MCYPRLLLILFGVFCATFCYAQKFRTLEELSEIKGKGMWPHTRALFWGEVFYEMGEYETAREHFEFAASRTRWGIWALYAYRYSIGDTAIEDESPAPAVTRFAT